MNGREIAPDGYVASLMRMVIAALWIENVRFKRTSCFAAYEPGAQTVIDCLRETTRAQMIFRLRTL